MNFNWKRYLSLVMAIMLIISLVPTNFAHAEESESETGMVVEPETPAEGGEDEELASVDESDTPAESGEEEELAPIAESNVAKVGEQGYESLQAAIDAAYAAGGDVTITLLDAVAENVTVTEKVGLYLTIDGKDKTMYGNITFNSLSDTNNNRRTTVQNVNFVTDGTLSYFIKAEETNHYPRLSVLGCSFTGTGNDATVAVRTKSAYDLIIKNCSGTGLHSFLQNTSGVEITVQNVTVSDSKGGLAMGTAQNVEIRNCNLTTRTYGIRLDAVLDTSVTLNGNIVNAYIPVSVRKATATDYKMTMTGSGSSYTATNTDGVWMAICADEYEEGVALNKPTGNVKIAWDTNLDKSGVYGAYEWPVEILFTDGTSKGFDTLTAAMNYGTSQTIDKIVVHEDITEGMDILEGNITTDNPNGVTIKNTIVDAWIYCSENFTIGEGVTYDATGYESGLFMYADNAVINGTVLTDCYYQRYENTKLTINEPGSMTVKTETFILRDTQGDGEAGIYIVGDNDDTTIGLNASVIWFYQGCINAKDADIKVGTYSQTQTTDANAYANAGAANLILDNTNMTVTVNEHNFKATGDSTVTLTNGSHVTVAGGYEGVAVVKDATSTFTVARGEVPFVVNAAQIGNVTYKTVAEALAAAKDGDTVIILAGEHSEDTIKLPATLNNVTIKGEEGAVLKDTTISAADGNSYSYIGLTFDGLTFDNGRILLTGWRNGEEIIENLTVTNCTFKNLNDDTNSAPVHINKDASKAVKNFTFTNNVIDGATGGSKSGVYAQVTGNVVFTGNTINNVSFRPYVIQLTTDDGIADEFIVTGNTFSGSTVGRAQGLGNNSEGTDTVKLVVSQNIFKGITNSQQICYWNFNAETTTADLSKNYYDIDIAANPSRIYYNSGAADVADLIAMGVYPYYKDEAMTELVTAPYIMVTYADGTVEYFDDMLEAVPYTTNYPKLEGATITLLQDTSGAGMRFMENDMVFDLNGHTYTITAGTGSQGTNTSGFQIRPEVTTNVIFKNGTIKVAEGAPVVWMFNCYATDFIVENVTVDCTNMAWSYGESCYVVVSRSGDNVQFVGNTKVINFNSEVAGAAINVGGTMTIGDTVDVSGLTVELDAGATLTAPAGLDVVTADGYKVVYSNGVYTSKSTVYKVSTKAELDAALAAAQEGETILLIADIDYGVNLLTIDKPITLDLGDKTLTTRWAYGGMTVKNNPTIKNGTIVHASNTSAIKVWNAAAFEDLVIDVQGKGDANKTIGGIVLQSGTTTHVGSIENVTIKGDALTNGIETYNCGDAAQNVIGSMENVTIDAKGTGMLISAPCGTATNCSISGDVNGIEIWIKGTYSASLDLVNSTVEGSVFAHDEFSSNPDIVNNGTLSLTVDDATTGVEVEDITLTIARAENVTGTELKYIMDNAQAKVNDTYYLTLTEAMKAAQAGDTVTIFAGTYALPAMKAGITVVGEVNADGTPAVLLEGTLSGTLENLTLKNLHIKGGNAQRWAYAKGNLVFENVTFEATSVYALHFDGITEGANLLYKDCTIIGWAAMSGSPASCVFDGCTIKGNGSYGVIRTYFDATIENCTFDVDNVNTTDVYQDGIHAVGGAEVTVNNCTNVNGDMKDLVNISTTSVVVLDGVKIQNVAKVTSGEGEEAVTTYYLTLDEAVKAAQAGDEVTILAAGTYKVPTGKNITITGAVEGVKFDMSKAVGVNASMTFNNVTFEYGNANYVGLQHAGTMVYNDCTINGQVFLYGTSETFNNCTFNQISSGAYNVWTYGAKEVAFNECTFNSAGKSVLIYSEQADLVNNVTVTKSTFTASTAVDGKAAIEMDSSLTSGINLTVDGATTATGFGSGDVSGNSLWNNKKGSNTDANNDITVVVDGVTVLAPATFVAKIGDTGYTTIADAIKAANDGDTVTILAGDYTIDVSVNKAITVVGEGTVNITGRVSVSTGATVKNLNVHNEKTGDYDCALVVNGKDIVLDGVKLTGYNAMRYCYTNGNITVKNSTINGNNFAVHFDGSNGGNIAFENCDITGWCSYASTIGAVSYTNCSIDQGNYSGHRYYNKNVSFTDCDFAEGIQLDLTSSNTKVSFTDGDLTEDEVKAMFANDGYYVAKGNITLNGNTITYAASANGKYYDTLQAAIDDIPVDGATYWVYLRSENVLEASVKIPAGKKLTLNLNGFNITGTDNATGSFALIEIQPGAELTIDGDGKITLTATNNRGWNAYSSVISNQRGKLVIENGTIEHLGGTDMAYGIDNLTNGKGTYAETVINGGTIKSTYRAIRQFLNGVEAQNILTINGGTIEGANKSVWMQDPSKNANTGELTVSESAKLIGDVYLYVTPGSTEWPVEVSIANAAFEGESTVLTGNVPDGYVVENANGTWGVRTATYVAQIGEKKYESLQAAINAATAGQTVTLLADITEDVTVNKSLTIDGAGKTYTGKMTLSNKADIAIKNVNFDGKGYNGYAINSTGAYYITIEDCTAKNYGYGFVQIANGAVLTTVKNVTVSDCAYGIKIDYSNAVVLDNVKLSCSVAGLLNSNYGAKTITVKGSEISILGTWTRNDTVKTTYVFEGENTVGQFVIEATLDTFKLADVNSTLTAPNTVTVTTDVADYEVKYENGTYKLVEKVVLFEIQSSNIVLGNELAMYFYVANADLEGTDYVAVVTKYYADGREPIIVEIPYADWEARTDNRMRFKFDGIAAKEMNDNIEVVIKVASSGEVASEVYTDSIRGYIKRGFDAGKATGELATMLMDMLNYGAAAQRMFKYDVENLANAGMDAYQQYATQDITCVNGQQKGNGYKSLSLTLESSILFNMKFQKTHVTQDMTAVFTFTDHYGKAHEVKVAGSEFVDEGNVWQITLKDLVVADASQLVTCTFLDADGNVVEGVYGVDSVESYCARAIAGNGGDYYEYIMKFCKSAYNYFH